MKTIADIIIDVLNGRGGFDHWWGDIDPEDKREIKTAINIAVIKFSGNVPGLVTNQKTEKP